ncbi:T9SS type A sorting domain-containing protein [bacterium]|nr:T9SS type A sorting domain-containing protein [bacterium]
MNYRWDKITFAICLLLFYVVAAFSCTITVVAPSDAHGALLWKNRDVSNEHQEVRYFDSESYHFIANVYEGETDRAWSGVNEAGLAIVNTDTYNQGSWVTLGDDDGHIMFHALGHFSNVNQFEEYLDSTNISIRRSTHCYALIDSTGAAVLFEAGRDYYFKYDASDDPDGFIVRTNYADSGSVFDRVGMERRTRAEFILSTAEIISPQLLIFGLARDLVTEEIDPYPLPFDFSFGTYPNGVIEARYTINRYYTTSASIIVGNNNSNIPTTMWQYLGQPINTIPIPLWVQARGLPPSVYGPDGSSLCDLAIELKSLVYTGIFTIDTYAIADILDRFSSVEEMIQARIDSEIDRDSITRIDLIEFAALQSDFANMILAKYWEIRSLYVREARYFVPENPDIAVYPNPFNSSGNIIFDSDRCGSVDINIYNQSGRFTSTPVANYRIYRGDNKIPLHLAGFPSGRYIAELVLDGSRVTSSSFILLK